MIAAAASGIISLITMIFSVITVIISQIAVIISLITVIMSPHQGGNEQRGHTQKGAEGTGSEGRDRGERTDLRICALKGLRRLIQDGCADLSASLD